MLKSDIPFSRDDANSFLPWMIALMSAITALMLCVGITFGEWVHGQPAKASAGFSVQVPPQGEQHAATLKQIDTALHRLPGVKSVQLLEDDAVRELVSPWLGDGDALQALPMPSVFEVTMQPRAQVPDYAALTAQLQNLAPDVSVDTQAVWAEKFSRLSRVIQAGVYLLAGAIIAALAGMMVFTARAAMKLHASSVLLLHSIGADDRYIARQFQANASRLALRGAVPGAVAAGLVYALLGYYATGLDVPLMPSLIPGLPHIIMLLALPVICCIISIVAVRMATLSQLKLLP